MDRNRTRANLEDLSNGPSIGQPNTLTQNQFTIQSIPSSGVENIPTRAVSLDTGLDRICPSSVADTESSLSSPTSVRLELGVLGCLGCDQELGNLCSFSRKRRRTKLGRFGRNIRYKVICGFFTEEGNTQTLFIQQNSGYSPFNYVHAEESLYNPKGC